MPFIVEGENPISLDLEKAHYEVTSFLACIPFGNMHLKDISVILLRVKQ